MPKFLIPLKPKHEDEFKKRRKAIFRSIPNTPRRRMNFKTFWREVFNHSLYIGIPRPDRRRLALQFYRDRKEDV